MLASCSDSRVEETRSIGKNFYGIAVSKDVKSATDFETIARDKCGSRDFCKVAFWYGTASLPNATPMTEEQAAQQVALYDWNKTTGFNRFLVNCKTFPGTASDKCF